MVVPVLTPVTVPLTMPTVATAGLVLVHTPPAVPSDKVMEVPVHCSDAPVTGSTTGTGSTFTILLATLVPHAPLTV